MKYKALGDFIKRSREACIVKETGLPMTQIALSKMLGVKHQFISSVERGVVNFPLKYAATLCKILDITKWELRGAYLKTYAEHLEKYLPHNLRNKDEL